MKNRIVVKLLFMLTLLASSACQTGSIDSSILHGKWGYLNIQDERGEFWFKENLVLHIDETGYHIDFYKYLVVRDSLLLLDISSNNRVEAFSVHVGDGNSLIAKNEAIRLQLEKFDDEADFDTTHVSKSKIYNEFAERLID